MEKLWGFIHAEKNLIIREKVVQDLQPPWHQILALRQE